VKVIKAILTVIDWAAMAILFLGCVALVGLTIIGAISTILKQLRASWSQNDERILLLIIAGSIAWCVLRRKKLF